MPPKPIPVGTPFGRWTTLAEVESDGYYGCVLVRCSCVAGTERIVRCTALRNKTSTSCGCILDEKRRYTGIANPKFLGVEGIHAPSWWLRNFFHEVNFCQLCGEVFRLTDKNSRRCVDHAPVCIGQHVRRSACKHCVRGVVHVGCNRDIAVFDKYNLYPEWTNRRPVRGDAPDPDYFL